MWRYFSLIWSGFVLFSLGVPPSAHATQSVEAKAVEQMITHVGEMLDALQHSIEQSQKLLQKEQDVSDPRSYRKRSQDNLKDALVALSREKSTEITDALVQKARSDKPDDTIGVTYLADHYFAAIQAGVAEASAHVEAERAHYALMTAELAAMIVAQHQLTFMKTGLETFKNALERRSWWADPVDMSAFFASDDFKFRITGLSGEIEKIQKELAKKEPQPGTKP